MLARIANKEEPDQTVFQGQSGSVLFQLGVVHFGRQLEFKVLENPPQYELS